MKTGLAAILSLILSGMTYFASVSAETVMVKSGEHQDFTRVVIQMARPSEWRFGRANGGYELRLGRSDIELDLSRAFEKIPRKRLRSLETVQTGTGLNFLTNCLCYADATEFLPGILVIDLHNGPAPKDSVFEARLDGGVGPTKVAAMKTTRAKPGPLPSEAERLRYFWGDIGKNAVLDPEAIPEQSAQRDGIPATSAGTPPGGGSFGFDTTADNSIPSLASGHAAQNLGVQPVEITGKHSAPPEISAAVVPQVAPHTGVADAPDNKAPLSDETTEAAIKPGLPAPALSQGQSPTPAPVLPLQLPRQAQMQAPSLGSALRLPNPTLDAARAVLLHQLSRAATQGLLNVDQPEHPLLPSNSVLQPTGAPVIAAAPGPELSSRPVVDDHVTIKAETSIDRDTLQGMEPAPVTPNGLACLTEQVFDVPAWGDDRPMAEQLAEKRMALVGEFDAPSSDAVEGLAKLYLYFGFGAEARETLRAFGVPVPNADLLQIMAESMDNGAAADAGRLTGMADCDTAAALWASLAQPRFAAGEPVNIGAVLRNFSGLPIQLRRLIGPPLSARFLDIGNEDAARSLRDATTRAIGDPGPATRLVGARLDLERHETAQAEAILEGVVAEDGAASPEALILLIDTQIKQGIKVAANTVQTAAGLAFEHRGTQLGSRLARAEVLAKAASGDFDDAFSTLDLQTRRGPDAMPTELDKDLFTLLATKADDATFMRHILGSEERLIAADLPRDLRQALADRMVTLGFPRAALTTLAASGKPKPPDLLILAKIALTQDDAANALRLLDGLTGPGAALIEANALTKLGYHAKAALAFQRAQLAAETASAGWRSGNARVVEQFGTDQQKAAVIALNAKPNEPAAANNTGFSASPSPPLGPLARNRALLAQSQATRETLAALLDAFPVAPGDMVQTAP